jgi:hypothetical protein
MLFYWLATVFLTHCSFHYTLSRLGHWFVRLELYYTSYLRLLLLLLLFLRVVLAIFCDLTR